MGSKLDLRESHVVHPERLDLVWHYRLRHPVRIVCRAQSGGLQSQPIAPSNRGRRRQRRRGARDRPAQEFQSGAGHGDLGQCRHQRVHHAAVGFRPGRARRLLLLGSRHHAARRDRAASLFFAQRAADDRAISSVLEFPPLPLVSRRQADGTVARLVAREGRHELPARTGHPFIDRPQRHQWRRHRTAGSDRSAQFSRSRRRAGDRGRRADRRAKRHQHAAGQPALRPADIRSHPRRSVSASGPCLGQEMGHRHRPRRRAGVRLGLPINSCAMRCSISSRAIQASIGTGRSSSATCRPSSATSSVA